MSIQNTFINMFVHFKYKIKYLNWIEYNAALLNVQNVPNFWSNDFLYPSLSQREMLKCHLPIQRQAASWTKDIYQTRSVEWERKTYMSIFLGMLALICWMTVTTDYLLLSHSQEKERVRERKIVVTPNFGELFQHYYSSILKKTSTIVRFDHYPAS